MAPEVGLTEPSTAALLHWVTSGSGKERNGCRERRSHSTGRGLQTDQHPLILYGVPVPCIGLAMIPAYLRSMVARVNSRRPGRWLDVVRPARLHERLVVGNHDVAIHA
jgi:hypothetical protein